jgi:hypothetical protein
MALDLVLVGLLAVVALTDLLGPLVRPVVSLDLFLLRLLGALVFHGLSSLGE